MPWLPLLELAQETVFDRYCRFVSIQGAPKSEGPWVHQHVLIHSIILANISVKVVHVPWTKPDWSFPRVFQCHLWRWLLSKVHVDHHHVHHHHHYHGAYNLDRGLVLSLTYFHFYLRLIWYNRNYIKLLPISANELRERAMEKKINMEHHGTLSQITWETQVHSGNRKPAHLGNLTTSFRCCSNFLGCRASKCLFELFWITPW